MIIRVVFIMFDTDRYFGDVINNIRDMLDDIEGNMERVDSFLAGEDDFELENDFIKIEKALQGLANGRLPKIWRASKDLFDRI